MPKHLPPELKQKVRALYEGSTLTHAQIGAETGVAESTVSVWGAAGGWTRPRGARVTARLVLAQRATVARLSRNGARAADVAAAAGCHRRTVGRIAAEPFADEPLAAEAPTPEPPPHLAELHAALVNPSLRKEEAVPLLTRAATAVAADALLAPNAQAERTARALASLAHCLAALPDQGPHAGAGLYPDTFPGTYAEQNALIEELAQHLCDFGVMTEDGEAVVVRDERERRERLLARAAQDEPLERPVR
jgi:hypothetical protein